MVDLFWIEDSRIETTKQNIIDSIILAEEQGDDKFTNHLYKLGASRLGLDRIEFSFEVLREKFNEM